MQDNQNNTRKTKVLIICGVMVFSAVTASWTFSERPLSNHECYVSITAREMLESGDWTWPTCNGEPRLRKTPLPYWLVAGLAQITGDIDEFTARMPSVIFAVLSVAAVIYFVNQLLGFRIAVLSAGVWASTLAYIRYARHARPEMVLTFFIVMCFLSFYSAINAKSRKSQVVYMLIFWTSFGLGMLAKGPMPLPIVLLPLLFYISISRKWRQVPKLLPIIGPVIFLAIVLPWPLVIAHKLDWDLTLWKREFVDRFFGTYASSGKPIYYYLSVMFQFMLPWVAFVPMALAAPFYKIWGKKQKIMLFLWVWFVVGLVFISISVGKRQHYILPLMPAMAILAGISLEDLAFRQKAYTKDFARSLLLWHLVILTIAFIGLPIGTAIIKRQALYESIVIAATGVVVVLIVTALFRAGKTSRAFVALFTGISILVMLCCVSLVNPYNRRWLSKRFTLTVAQKVPAPDKLIAYKSATARFIYYFGKVVPKIEEKSEVYDLYEQGWWVVAFGTYLDELLKDNKDLEIVYMEEKAEWHRSTIVRGALLHKSGGGSKDKI